MKKRYFIATLFIFFVLFSSCNRTYYYSFLDSGDNNIRKLTNGEFILDDDLVTIVFSFREGKEPLNISVYNRLEYPIVWDLSQSFMMNGSDVLRLTDMSVNAEAFLSPGLSREAVKRAGFFPDDMVLSEQVVVIPPGVRIHTPSYPVKEKNAVCNIPERKFTMKEIYDQHENLKVAQIKDFSFEDSPFHLQFSFTFYKLEKKEYKEQEFSYNQEFYISKVIKTNKIRPSDMNNEYRNRFDIIAN